MVRRSNRHRRPLMLCVQTIFAVCLSGATVIAEEQTEQIKGGQTYVRYCAVCHGVGGEGNGSLADALVKPPANLTTLSQQNNGVFPEARVKKIIEYGGAIKGHGASNMLAWGAFFSIESDNAEVDARIDSLSTYIKSLQKK